VFPVNMCPDTLLGTGTKNANGTFTVMLNTPLVPGHFIYAVDLCNAPPFDVGAAVFIPLYLVPVASNTTVAGLAAVLSIVGLISLLRLRRAK
jgi:hypothetical protein